MDERKFAAILGVYGRPADRFMAGGYKTSKPDVFERLKMAGQQAVVRGVELIQGENDDLNTGNKGRVKAALDDNGLSLCAVNPNLWGEMHWAKGTLGSNDPAIRRRAIDRIKQAMDLAAELGCPYVGIWPGQDGYDYLFEIDYAQAYQWWVEGVQECADHNPAIRIGLEYKPYEPRTHSLIDTAPKTLLMLADIARTNVGLTLDVGHALVAHENLGEVVALAQRRNKLFHVHLNDNYSDWDWDLNFGAVHLQDFIELVYWLKRTRYEGWYSVDIFAYRTEGAGSVAESLAWLGAVMDLVEQTGMEKFDQLIQASDPLTTSRFLREILFVQLHRV